MRFCCWLGLNHDVFKVCLFLYFQEIYLCLCYNVVISEELSGLSLPDPKCSSALMPCASHTVLQQSPFSLCSKSLLSLQAPSAEGKEAPGPPSSFPASWWIQWSLGHGIESKAEPWRSWWKFHVQFGGTHQHDGQ